MAVYSKCMKVTVDGPREPRSKTRELADKKLTEIMQDGFPYAYLGTGSRRSAVWGGWAKAFWCVWGVIFSGDPYDFHMGPERERAPKKPSNDV